jgi:hypothetical protein
VVGLEQQVSCKVFGFEQQEVIRGVGHASPPLVSPMRSHRPTTKGSVPAGYCSIGKLRELGLAPSDEGAGFS